MLLFWLQVIFCNREICSTNTYGYFQKAGITQAYNIKYGI